MEIKKNSIIKFNNGDYLVVDTFKNKDNIYLYLINNSETEDDVSIVKVDNDNGLIKYSQIEDEEEFNYVINKLFLNNIEEIKEFYE